MTDRPYKLPEGWRWVRLEEVCEVIMGQSPPSSSYNHEGAGLPFFQGKADFGEVYPAPRVWCTEPKKVAEAGDILISVRAPVGPTNLVDSKCCIGRGLAALRVGSVADRFWLLFYLGSIEDELATSGSGSTFNAITKTELRSLPIPLPPLDEQRRIVARIEALMARVREARRLRQAAREEARRLWQSVLADTFPRPGSPLPPGWRWVRLGEVAEVCYGKANPKKPGGVPVVGSSGVYDYTASPLISFPTVVVGRKGNAGEAVLVKEPCWPSDTVFYLRWRVDVSPEWVTIWLKVHKPSSEGTSPTLPSLRREELERHLIPLPPLTEQRRIVKRLEALREKLRALEAAQAQTDETLKRLEQAVLEKAFRGEL